MDSFKKYGIEPMSFLEEMALPKPVNQTRNNKVQIIEDCRMIAEMAKELIEYTKIIPTLDDEKHANLVQGLAERIHSVRIQMTTINKTEE